MQDTKPLPKDIEALIAIAESDRASIRNIIGTAYQLGRFDGMVAFAKVDLKPVASVSEVAA